MKHEIDFIIKHDGFLGEKQWKTKLVNHLSYISMKTIFINTEHIKTNEPYKHVLDLLQRLDLSGLDKHVALQKVSIY